MKTELAPTSSDLSLLPRADLPVIWDGFTAKVQELHQTASTLVVSSVEEKDKMELARTTRLTLKQIRVAVEKKRVELGQGHLAEIQKINGAANKLKELIEPLEGRLLHQELFAERVEKARIAALSASRAAEIRSVSNSAFIGSDLGDMLEEIYQNHMKVLRSERAEREENLRRQTEAAAILVAQKAEAEARLEVERAELQRQNERVRREYEEQRAKEAAARAEVEARFAAERQEAEEKFRQEQAEKDRLRDEELKAVEAKRLELEVALANERAAKLAEERRLHALAVAPDKEQLREFHRGIYNIPQPELKTYTATTVLNRAQSKLAEALLIIDVFLNEE